MLRVALGVLMGGLMLACEAAGAAAGSPWLTGVNFQERMVRPMNVDWSGNPLRAAIEDLSRVQQVAVIIDRRVDPGQKISLALEGVPLATAFQEIARRQSLGCRMLGPVVYFGPSRSAMRLRTTAALRTEEVRRLPGEIRGRLLALKPMAWNDLATPRELLSQLAQENGLTLTGLERVPHDLWAAADLPPLSLVDRFTLIAAQWDLTFQIAPNGQRIEIVPLPDRVALVRNYDGGRQPQTVAKQFAALAPGARVTVVGDKVRVEGLLEEHEQIAASRLLATPPGRPSSVEAGEIHIDKMSFKEVPVGDVLQQLARKLKLDLSIDREALQAAGISLQQRISVDVRDVTVDRMLAEVGKAARLHVHRRDNILEVGPAK